MLSGTAPVCLHAILDNGDVDAVLCHDDVAGEILP